MSNNISALEKQAIDLALRGAWKEAQDINTQILEMDPQNLGAKLRLGRAFIQLKEFSKAKKIFEEVLKQDPVNQIAKKNLQAAKEQKIESNGTGTLSTKDLIKIPGTSTEVQLLVSNKRVNIGNLVPGENLKLKVTKNHIEVMREDSISLGFIENKQVIQSVNSAKAEKAEVEASFIKSKDDHITILLKSSAPVFSWDKQDIKPYLKKGTIEEPELEMSTLEEVETE